MSQVTTILDICINTYGFMYSDTSRLILASNHMLPYYKLCYWYCIICSSFGMKLITSLNWCIRLGGRSLIAAYLLVLNGYKNVFHLDGGLYSWFKEGLPVVAEKEWEAEIILTFKSSVYVLHGKLGSFFSLLLWSFVAWH